MGVNMNRYEVQLEGWVTDTVYVTAADKAEAVALATKEFNNLKGTNTSRVTIIEETVG
tara:strand:- start:506 stop:679 length:174 start_codon:yes stop_codon:yes gene_type:complete